MEQFDSKYLRGQGPLFVGGRDATGKSTGLIFVGDLSSLELTPQVDRMEVIENVSGASGVGASAIKSSKYNLAIVMRSIKKDHLAIALQGAATAKAAASVTDEAHTAYLDKVTPLEHNKVSSVVITGSGGTPTYVENTDYVVHADEGLIEFISGGTITDATPVLIDYDYAAQSHVTTSPNNAAKYLVFAGKNTLDDDKQTRVEIFKVKLDPGVFSMITEENAEANINGTVELDTLRSAGDQFFTWKVED